MLCAYVLASTLVALSLFARFATPSPIEITNEEFNIPKKQEERAVEGERCGPVASNDRSGNLKYVIAMQSLTIWSEIKKRMLTINTRPQIGEIAEKSPDKLTDGELAKLRQACQDGFKCVAVDQLIVLRVIVEPADGGKGSVQKTIAKIIKVLTQYTTEYRQDTYKYAEIENSDDLTKVKEMVTTIVEDNRELCQIDVDVVSDEKNTENDHTQVSNVSTNKALSNNKTPDNGTTHKMFIIDDGPSTAVDNNTNNTDGRPNRNGTKIVAPNANVPGKTNDSDITDVSINTDKANNDDKSVDSNINIKYTENPKEASDDNSKDSNMYADIASAGSSDNNVSRIGYAEDGIVNNGKMFTYNINNGLINKAVINMTDANNGIISVGTFDNGATDYGVVKNRTNNGMISNNIKTQNYMSSISNMYSAILKQFGKMQ